MDKYIHKAKVLIVLVLLSHALHQLALALTDGDILQILLVHFVVITKFEVNGLDGDVRHLVFYFFVRYLKKNQELKS